MVNPKVGTHVERLVGGTEGCRVLTRIKEMRILYDGGSFRIKALVASIAHYSQI